MKPKQNRRFLDKMLKKHADATPSTWPPYSTNSPTRTRPMAIGAQFTDRDRQVVSLGMVELEMLVAGLPSYGTTNKNPNALSIPPKISAEMVTGFALSASKIVLDGGVGRMLQMARSNLRNVPRP